MDKDIEFSSEEPSSSLEESDMANFKRKEIVKYGNNCNQCKAKSTSQQVIKAFE